MFSLYKRICFIFLLNSFTSSRAIAQEYSYKHYDVKDGLAGSTVYFIHQDKEGFIWFATETGLSRFDGTHFKSYTTKDGLPDNTILSIHEDSQGRVWFVPFKNSICYYRKGKIYNQQNDSLLKKIHIEDLVSGISENKKGEILLADPSHLYLINPSGAITSIGQEVVRKNSIGKIGTYNSGNFFFVNTYKVYSTDTKSFVLKETLNVDKGGPGEFIISDRVLCWMNTANTTIHIKSAFHHLEYSYRVPAVNTMFYLNDSVICLNTVNGTLLFNFLRRKIENRFLENNTVSCFLTDEEGGYWFATLNNGVYRLNSPLFKNLKTSTAGGQNLGVNDFQKAGNGDIWAASDMGYLQHITNNSVQLISLRNYAVVESRTAVTSLQKRGNLLVAGCGHYVYLKRLFSSFSSFSGYTGYNSIKQVVFKNDSELIVAGSNALYTSRLTQLGQHKLLWKGRTTCLLYRKGEIYFGTLNGLYLLKPDSTFDYPGSLSPLLRTRITDIKEDSNGIIWVVTGNDGVIGLKDKQVKWHINESNGLISNTGRCVTIDSGCIWVGTDKGLNRISIHNNAASIMQYSSSDGLASDIINTVFIDGNTVYAGTPEGISFFDKTIQTPLSVCKLKMLSIAINGKKTDAANTINLQYGNNSIRFDYVAISFKSAGNNVYNYRLKGFDTSWKTTTQTSLEFISLPPGQYELELFAVNQFGIKSGLYTVQLWVSAPYWQTAWFIVGCIMVSMLATAFIITRRNQLMRRRELAKQRVEQQLQELEQKALRAQMNPHFIFNCMNSIQAFILDRDIGSSNKYISKFASLIRQTLNNSFQPFISVVDEIKYITTYLNLEQMRYNNKFSYTIHVDQDIMPAEVFIPGMMLQPYIENAIRHGIHHRHDDRGQVDISFTKKENHIICTIRDNGIGRENAQIIKTSQPRVYQSHGMQLTQERIDLMNKNARDKITVEITDHTDNEGMASGTGIVIRFPFFNADKQDLKI
jgi:ligand-binding sensor domain-containing protein